MAEVASGSSSQKRTRTGSCQKRKRPRLKSGCLVLDCMSNWTTVEPEEARRLSQRETSHPPVGTNSSDTMDETALRRRAIHRPGNEMELWPSLAIIGSRRARSGNNRHASHGVDSMDGDVVDLTTDSGVEDDEVVDITDQHVHPPVIIPEEEYLHQRPSCRFSKPHSLVNTSNSVSSGDTDVIVISSPVGEPAQSSRLPGSRNKSKPQQSLASTASGGGSDVGSSSQESTSTKNSIICPICLDTIQQFEATGRKLVTTQCGHIFCNVCIRNSISTLHRCPTCRKKLNLKQYHHLYL